MLDAPYSRPDKSAFDIDWIGVKASQFSFSLIALSEQHTAGIQQIYFRLHCTGREHHCFFRNFESGSPVLGVDMSSTGEVGCIGDDFSEALLNSMIATGFKIAAVPAVA